jgi:endonuclease YncB( thermonuclease family)
LSEFKEPILLNGKLVITTFLLSFFAGLNAATLHGRVVSISDGDSITIIDTGNKQHKIRLLGIDAPEINQSYGQKSKQSLFELVNGRHIEIEFKKKDKFGRTIGKVFF